MGWCWTQKTRRQNTPSFLRGTRWGPLRSRVRSPALVVSIRVGTKAFMPCWHSFLEAPSGGPPLLFPASFFLILRETCEAVHGAGDVAQRGHSAGLRGGIPHHRVFADRGSSGAVIYVFHLGTGFQVFSGICLLLGPPPLGGVSRRCRGGGSCTRV